MKKTSKNSPKLSVNRRGSNSNKATFIMFAVAALGIYLIISSVAAYQSANEVSSLTSGSEGNQSLSVRERIGGFFSNLAGINKTTGQTQLVKDGQDGQDGTGTSTGQPGQPGTGTDGQAGSGNAGTSTSGTSGSAGSSGTGQSSQSNSGANGTSSSGTCSGANCSSSPGASGTGTNGNTGASNPGSSNGGTSGASGQSGTGGVSGDSGFSGNALCPRTNGIMAVIQTINTRVSGWAGL